MSTDEERLRKRLEETLLIWAREGMPGRQGLEEAGRAMTSWREHEGIRGLWNPAPLMVTATIDDGFGFGLAVIEAWSKATGVELISLGLLQEPEDVIAACREHQPDFLGMTVLQFGSEEEVAEISEALPEKTRLIAGGPIFSADPELAERSGIDFVARTVAEYLRFLLDLDSD